MQNLLKKFRTDLSQVVLNAIWGAWSQVGVMGHGENGAARIVDPEPLLLLTWECARQDSRVFDEVLDWLVRNGRWVNVVRLTTLLNEDQTCTPSLAGAVAAFMMMVGILASVMSGATASASGVRTKPVRNWTWSRVMSSCARRLATAGSAPAVSRLMSTIWLPPALSPFCLT